MPRRTTTPQQKRDRFTATLGLEDDVLKITYVDDVPHLQCTYCDRRLQIITLQAVQDHVQSQRHLCNIDLRKKPREPPPEDFDATSPRKNPFFKEVHDFMVACDIPFEKLELKAFRVRNYQNFRGTLKKPYQRFNGKIESNQRTIYQLLVCLAESLKSLPLHIRIAREVKR